MVVLAGVVASMVAGRAMRVVHDMAALADDWGEHDPGRRFAVGDPRDEFGELARTLDHLLDRVERAIADERRLTDEIAHELRTPLTALRGEVQLAELGGTPVPTQAVSREVDRLSAAVTAILTTARQRVEATARSPLADALHKAVGDRGVEVGPMAGLHVGLPTDVVVGIVSPLLDNAVRHAASRVWVTARPEPGRVVLQVFDDGPGFSPADVERVFEPGVTTGRGHGLGLALVLRMARAAGVQVRAVAEGRGHVEVILPQAERAS
jgi:signal transduction histidine kinase